MQYLVVLFAIFFAMPLYGQSKPEPTLGPATGPTGAKPTVNPAPVLVGPGPQFLVPQTVVPVIEPRKEAKPNDENRRNAGKDEPKRVKRHSGNPVIVFRGVIPTRPQSISSRSDLPEPDRAGRATVGALEFRALDGIARIAVNSDADLRASVEHTDDAIVVRIESFQLRGQVAPLEVDGHGTPVVRVTPKVDGEDLLLHVELQRKGHIRIVESGTGLWIDVAG